MNNRLVAKLNLCFFVALTSLLAGCRNIEIRLPYQEPNYKQIQIDYKDTKRMFYEHTLVVLVCDVRKINCNL